MVDILALVVGVLGLFWAIWTFWLSNNKPYKDPQAVLSLIDFPIEVKSIILKKNNNLCCYCRSNQDVALYVLKSTKGNLRPKESFVLCTDCVTRIREGKLNSSYLGLIRDYWVNLCAKGITPNEVEMRVEKLYSQALRLSIDMDARNVKLSRVMLEEILTVYDPNNYKARMLLESVRRAEQYHDKLLEQTDTKYYSPTGYIIPIHLSITKRRWIAKVLVFFFLFTLVIPEEIGHIVFIYIAGTTRNVYGERMPLRKMLKYIEIEGQELREGIEDAVEKAINCRGIYVPRGAVNLGKMQRDWSTDVRYRM